MASFLSGLMRWHRDTRAVAKVEYAILIGLVLITCVIGLELLGDSVNVAFTDVETAMHGEAVDIQSDDSPDMAAVEQETWTEADRAEALAIDRFLVLLLCTALFGLMAFRLWCKYREEKADEAFRQQTGELSTELIFEKRHTILTEMFRDVNSLYQLEVRIGQVMTQQVVSVAPNTPVDELKKIVFEQRKRHLLVCDSDGELLGVISDRDLLGRDGRTAARLMTKNPMTVERDSLLDPAVTLMIRHRISCLPVMQKGKLCGLLTSTDVMMALQCMSQAIQRISGEKHVRRQFDTVELNAMELELEHDMAAGT